MQKKLVTKLCEKTFFLKDFLEDFLTDILEGVTIPVLTRDTLYEYQKLNFTQPNQNYGQKSLIK